MRKFVFALCILFSMDAIAQDLAKDIEKLREQAAQQRASLDSSRKATDSFIMQQMKRNDSVEMARYMEQNNRNLDAFMKTMKERERKQKQGMWMRIGAGILILGVGIYGVMRKRTPTSR